jgi:dihydroorotase
MKKAMENAVQAGVMFSCHTEDMNYRRPGASVHEGPVAQANGWTGIPSACESAQLVRDLKLAKETGVKYHADHLSAKESVRAVKEAKAAGTDCSAEVTAHHLLLEDIDVKGTNWKMNPPLRTHEDRMALIEGLENGTLDFIANDHAPHTKEQKERGMDKAPFGIVALETSFPLLYTEFVQKQKRWSLKQLLEWMSEKPAERFGLERTGRIQKGYRADFFLADLDADETIDSTRFYSKGKNTPFDGWRSCVSIEKTWCDGKAVHEKN